MRFCLSRIFFNFHPTLTANNSGLKPSILKNYHIFREGGPAARLPGPLPLWPTLKFTQRKAKELSLSCSVSLCVFGGELWEKVSCLLSWTWVEGGLRRVGYRTGLYSSHQSSHTPTCGDRKKYMTMPQLRRGAATNKESFVEASMIGTGLRW